MNGAENPYYAVDKADADFGVVANGEKGRQEMLDQLPLDEAGTANIQTGGRRHRRRRSTRRKSHRRSTRRHRRSRR
jgi:hypothetical protein